MSTTAPLPPPAGNAPATPAAPADPGTDYLDYARTGDAAALERALHGCADRATTQARRLLGNAADADDAVQEAFLQLTRTARRYDGRVPFAAWVGRLVHTACLRVRRSDRRRRRREASAMTPLESSDPPPDDGTQEAVRSAIARLPASDQSAIDLHYFAGLSQAETAAALGTSENALAQRLVRARERLRRLLAGHGTTLSVAALATLLASQPAHAASPAALAAAGSLATAVANGTALPVTSIHLTWAQKGSLFMSAHPLATVSCGVLLVALGCTPLALWAAEIQPAADAKPTDPVPVATHDGPWNPAAREVLRWLEPQAPLHVAADLATWRKNAAAVRPLALFTDPQAAPALARMRAALLADEPEPATRAAWAVLFHNLEHGDAAALSTAWHERWVHALALPPAATEAMATELHDILDHGPRSAPATDAGTPGWRLGGTPREAELWVGMHGRFFASGTPAAVQTRQQQQATAPLPAAPPAGFWLHGDLGPLIAGYAAADAAARADGLHTNLDELSSLLGAQWRSAKPQVTITFDGADGVLDGTTRISGALPYSPFNLGALIGQQLGLSWPLPQLADTGLRAVDPARTIAAHPGTLAWATAGLTPEALASWWNAPDGLVQVVPEAVQVLPLLSGDVSLLVDAGAPLPGITLAFGLRSPADQALIAALAGGLGLPSVSATPTAALQAAGVSALWQGMTKPLWYRKTQDPHGFSGASIVPLPLQILLTPQRLVLTTAPDATPLLTAQVRPLEAPLVAGIDLPKLVTLYGPLLLSQLPAMMTKGSTFDAGCIPPMAVLARDLAPWHIAWSPTADGCTIHERGVPGLAAAVAIATVSLCATSNPETEVGILRTQAEWDREYAMQATKIAALNRFATRMAGGGPFTAAERAAMHPWFGGKVPSDGELAAFGSHYDQPTAGADFSSDDLAPRTVVLADGRIGACLLTRSDADHKEWTLGVLSWAAPLGDGWSIGIAGDKAGLFRGEPPTTNVRQLPKSSF